MIKDTVDLGLEKSSGAICECASNQARPDDLPSRIALGEDKPAEGMISR